MRKKVIEACLLMVSFLVMNGGVPSFPCPSASRIRDSFLSSIPQPLSVSI